MPLKVSNCSNSCFSTNLNLVKPNTRCPPQRIPPLGQPLVKAAALGLA